MKKLLFSLILPLLTISCGNTTSIDEGEWRSDIKADMILYLGEVLPFASFNEQTLEGEYTELTIEEYGENGNNYCITDDNENNVVIDYGDKLKAKGFKSAIDDIGYECYEKSTSRGKLVVYATWFPESTVLDVTAPAGNQIDAYLYFDN